jgi:hypothetical protein
MSSDGTTKDDIKVGDSVPFGSSTISRNDFKTEIENG